MRPGFAEDIFVSGVRFYRARLIPQACPGGVLSARGVAPAFLTHCTFRFTSPSASRQETWQME